MTWFFDFGVLVFLLSLFVRVDVFTENIFGGKVSGRRPNAPRAKCLVFGWLPRRSSLEPLGHISGTTWSTTTILLGQYASQFATIGVLVGGPRKIQHSLMCFPGEGSPGDNPTAPRDKCLASGQDSGPRAPDMVTVKNVPGQISPLACFPFNQAQFFNL